MMELKKAIEFYKIARNNTLEVRSKVEALKVEKKKLIDEAYSFGFGKGAAFEKHLEVINGLHFHEQALKKAEYILLQVFKEKVIEDPEYLEKIYQMGFKKDWINTLFERIDYKGIRIFIAELVIVSAYS